MSEARRMTYEQFAAEHGLVTDFDVQGHIHSGLMAAHMPGSYHRRYAAQLRVLQDARQTGMRRYKEAIEAGLVLPPQKMGRRERLELAASGHPDLESTQAAKRMLAKLAAPTPER